MIVTLALKWTVPEAPLDNKHVMTSGFVGSGLTRNRDLCLWEDAKCEGMCAMMKAHQRRALGRSACVCVSCVSETNVRPSSETESGGDGSAVRRPQRCEVVCVCVNATPVSGLPTPVPQS